MAILALNDSGRWEIDVFLRPVEFWPYTSRVQNVVMSGPRNLFDDLHKFLIQEFRDAGIQAYEENKSVFGLKDEGGRTWYLGFYDFRFSLGLSVSSDSGNKPLVAPTPDPAP